MYSTWYNQFNALHAFRTIWIVCAMYCTGWPKSPYTMFARPLPEIFILEYNYFSMVTDVMTPEKYDSAVKISITCIFLFKIEITRFFRVFSLLPWISVFQGLFYVFTIFLVRLHHWIYYYYTVPKPENAKFWLIFVLWTIDYQPNLSEFADFTAQFETHSSWSYSNEVRILFEGRRYTPVYLARVQM